MAQLPLRLTWDMAQDRWSSIINPVLGLPPVSGLFIKAKLNPGVNTINHLLQRNQQGWIVTDKDSPANIYRSSDFNTLTLQLTSDAVCNIGLWVY